MTNNLSLFGWPAQSHAAWFKIWRDTVLLTLESSAVVGLRTGVLAQGGKAAGSEAFDMVNEKIAAGLALQTKALSGALGMTAASVAAKTIRHYLPKARANRKRLVRLG